MEEAPLSSSEYLAVQVCSMSNKHSDFFNSVDLIFQAGVILFIDTDTLLGIGDIRSMF